MGLETVQLCDVIEHYPLFKLFTVDGRFANHARLRGHLLFSGKTMICRKANIATPELNSRVFSFANTSTGDPKF